MDAGAETSVACRAGRIDRIGTTITEQITKLREYRQALISAAVTGKLAVPQEVPS